MKRLDAYIFLELAKTTFVASLVSIVVILALQVLRLGDFIIDRSMSFAFLARMMGGLALSFAPLILPIAFLFALLLVFGRLSTDREFVAMQSLGQSPTRLIRPSLFFAVIVVMINLWVCLDLGPRGNRSFEASVDEAWSKKVMSVLRAGTFSESFLGMVVFVDKIDPVTQELRHIFIHDENNFQEEVSISAKKGEWVPPADNQAGVLRLRDGVLVSQTPLKDAVRRIQFDEYRIHADFTRHLSRDRGSPPSLGGGALWERRLQNKNNPATDPRPIWIEIARRLAATLSCLIFVPLCFALSLDNRRTAKSRAVFSGLIILVTYWTAYFSILTWLLGSRWPFIRQSEFFVAFMIWVPNLIVLYLGLRTLRSKLSLR